MKVRSMKVGTRLALSFGCICMLLCLILPPGKELQRQAQEARTKYIAGQDKLIALINEDNVPESRSFLADERRPVPKSYKEALNSLIAFHVALIEVSGKAAADTYAVSRNLMLGLGAFAILLWRRPLLHQSPWRVCLAHSWPRCTH